MKRTNNDVKQYGVTTLTEALENKDYEAALSLIRNKTFGNRMYRASFYLMSGGNSLLDSGNSSPLNIAASEGNMEVLHALLNAGAKVDSKNDWGWTPLLGALHNKQDAAAIALINAGADVNALFKTSNAGYPASNNFFPLHAAVRKNVGLPVIKLLVERGAKLNLKYGDPNHHNNGYDDILYEAVKYIPDENVDTIEFLLQQGANPNVYMPPRPYHLVNSALYCAIHNRKTRIAKALLLHGADIYLEARTSEGGRRYALTPDEINNGYALTPQMINSAIMLENDISVPAELMSQDPELGRQPAPPIAQIEVTSVEIAEREVEQEELVNVSRMRLSTI